MADSLLDRLQPGGSGPLDPPIVRGCPRAPTAEARRLAAQDGPPNPAARRRDDGRRRPRGKSRRTESRQQQPLALLQAIADRDELPGRLRLPAFPRQPGFAEAEPALPQAFAVQGQDGRVRGLLPLAPIQLRTRKGGRRFRVRPAIRTAAGAAPLEFAAAPGRDLAAEFAAVMGEKKKRSARGPLLTHEYQGRARPQAKQHGGRAKLPRAHQMLQPLSPRPIPDLVVILGGG